MIKLTTVVKKEKAHDSFMELLRLNENYIFDHVAIKRINFNPNGVEIHFEYTKNGKTIKDLPVAEFGASEWAAARAACKVPDDFAQTKIVERLFQRGVKEFTQRAVKVEADFAADLEFLGMLNPPIE